VDIFPKNHNNAVSKIVSNEYLSALFLKPKIFEYYDNLLGTVSKNLDKIFSLD